VCSGSIRALGLVCRWKGDVPACFSSETPHPLGLPQTSSPLNLIWSEEDNWEGKVGTA